MPGRGQCGEPLGFSDQHAQHPHQVRLGDDGHVLPGEGTQFRGQIRAVGEPSTIQRERASASSMADSTTATNRPSLSAKCRYTVTFDASAFRCCGMT